MICIFPPFMVLHPSKLFLWALQRAIDRKCAAPSHQQRDRNADRQQVVFKTLAGLLPHPIHKESILLVNREDRAQHHADHPQRAQPRQKSEDQPERAEKFGDHHHHYYHRGQPHPCHPFKRGFEPGAAEPPQHFLRAVREHHRAQRQAQKNLDNVFVRREQFSKHFPPPCFKPRNSVNRRIASQLTIVAKKKSAPRAEPEDHSSNSLPSKLKSVFCSSRVSGRISLLAKPITSGAVSSKNFAPSSVSSTRLTRRSAHDSRLTNLRSSSASRSFVTLARDESIFRPISACEIGSPAPFNIRSTL